MQNDGLIRRIVSEHDVVILGLRTCGWCQRAHKLLIHHFDDVKFYDLREHPELEPSVYLLRALKGYEGADPESQTVPKVFIRGKFIGGYDSVLRFLIARASL